MLATIEGGPAHAKLHAAVVIHPTIQLEYEQTKHPLGFARTMHTLQKPTESAQLERRQISRPSVLSSNSRIAANC